MVTRLHHFAARRIFSFELMFQLTASNAPSFIVLIVLEDMLLQLLRMCPANRESHQVESSYGMMGI
jgi:hypothetical protein